jgi:hypothetical protein
VYSFCPLACIGSRISNQGDSHITAKRVFKSVIVILVGEFPLNCGCLPLRNREMVAQCILVPEQPVCYDVKYSESKTEHTTISQSQLPVLLTNATWKQ